MSLTIMHLDSTNKRYKFHAALVKDCIKLKRARWIDSSSNNCVINGKKKTSILITYGRKHVREWKLNYKTSPITFMFNG